MTTSTYDQAPARPAADTLAKPLRVVSLATMALVIVQAALAGQWWFAGQAHLIGTHGWIGNVAYLGALALVVIGFLDLRQGRGKAVLGLAVALALLMTAQLGLGYMGRSLAWAASLHIPNGVLLTGIGFAIATLAFVRPSGSR